ncbi:hypothetical protein CK203_032004 [Vitis vinifera]|uniref:Uncharacterized protein n=1 Tax=Vitis vinifera TaxID=29760 RepID=A0A438FN17_VITVI|nr:hypothetical protein CK203_032004 [Vitis vinifera]
MLGDEKDSNNTPVEGSALASKGGENGYRGEQRTRRRVCCDHCNKLGHTKDKCWLLHGKPTNWRLRQSDGRGFQIAADAGTTSKREESATTQISLSKGTNGHVV